MSTSTTTPLDIQSQRPTGQLPLTSAELPLVQAAGQLVQQYLHRHQELRPLLTAFGEWLIAQSRDAGAGATHPMPQRGSSDHGSTASDSEAADPISQFSEIDPGERRFSGAAGRTMGSPAVDVKGEGPTAAGRPSDAAADDFVQASDGSASSSGAHLGGDETVDLELIERRCQLKAESCRLFIKRRAASVDPVRELALIDCVDRLIAKAKATKECFLWVLWRERSQPDDDVLLMLASCYEALGACASLLARIVSPDGVAAADMLEEAMQCAAEASSALRRGLSETWLPSADRDQDEMHLWLRRETAARRVFVSRYMRRDDVADPKESAGLLRHVLALRERAEATLQGRKK